MAARISLIGYFTPNMSLQWSWLIFGSHLLQQNCFGMKLLLQNFPCNSDNIYIWFNNSINVTTVTISYCSKHFVAINHQYMVQRYSNKTCRTSQKKKKKKKNTKHVEYSFCQSGRWIAKKGLFSHQTLMAEKAPFFYGWTSPFLQFPYIYNKKQTLEDVTVLLDKTEIPHFQA